MGWGVERLADGSSAIKMWSCLMKSSCLQCSQADQFTAHSQTETEKGIQLGSLVRSLLNRSSCPTDNLVGQGTEMN